MHQRGSVMVAALILLMIGGTIWYYGFRDRSHPLIATTADATLTPSTILPTIPTAREIIESVIDKCSRLPGSLFKSVNQYGRGFGAQGPIGEYWYVRFDDGKTLEWDHDGIGEDGTYTCRDNIIYVQIHGPSSMRDILYDPTRETFVWEGAQYKRVEQ